MHATNVPAVAKNVTVPSKVNEEKKLTSHKRLSRRASHCGSVTRHEEWTTMLHTIDFCSTHKTMPRCGFVSTIEPNGYASGDSGRSSGEMANVNLVDDRKWKR